MIASPWDGQERGAPVKPDEFYGVTPQTPMDGEDFERLATAGAGTVRVALDWSAIQQVPGDCQAAPAVKACNWTETDDLVGSAAAHGVRVMPIVGGARAFGRDTTTPEAGTIEHPPTDGKDLEGWKDFLAAAASRYGPGGAFWDAFKDFTDREGLPIRTWQVWNEPNAEQYWPPKPNPAEYASLVAGASDAIRSADPEAEIVLAGLFGTSALDSSAFLRDLYAVDGLQDDFDAIAIHPYSPDLRGIEIQVDWAREAAEAAGDAEVGLWVTELGWSSAEGEHPLELGSTGQAEMLTSSFRLLRRNRDTWNIRGIVWYTWQDRLDQGVCEFCREAGLFDVEDEPKPAWESFTRAVRR